MAYIAKIVGDEVLSAEPGWAMALTDDGDTYFLIRESSAVDEHALTDAWEAARHLRDNANEAMRQAVRAAHEEAS